MCNGKKREVVGIKFNNLTVIKELPERLNKKIIIECLCDCGKILNIRKNDVLSGTQKSCGCIRRKYNNYKHKLYTTWYHMIERCYNKDHISYKNYGARGIKVCDRWLESFDNFIDDVGERPKGMTLDRIDFNDDYTPKNCKWSTYKEQANNRRNNRSISYNGETKTLSEWDDILFNGVKTISNRLNKGWSEINALTIPKGNAKYEK